MLLDFPGRVDMGTSTDRREPESDREAGQAGADQRRDDAQLEAKQRHSRGEADRRRGPLERPVQPLGQST